MTALSSKSIYLWRNVRTALLGLTALCGAASPLFGQDMVGGKFTLTESTHVGNRILPAGRYKFSIETVGPVQAVNSIQSARQPVLVIMRPETSAAPVSSIFAMASRSEHALDSSKLVLEQVSDGMAMHTMYLDQQNLVLHFDWVSAKDKNGTLAAAAQPGPARASKATD